MNNITRHSERLNRVRRIRAKLSGTSYRPRLVIFRSLKGITVQLIDDTAGKTLVAASDRGLTGTRMERAQAVGQKIAELAKEKKIKTVVFDRAGNRYHGRVSALADAARAHGLVF